MDFLSQFIIILLCLTPLIECQVTEFVSIDCGGTRNYTDPHTGLAWISDNGMIGHGKSVEVDNKNGNSLQYQRRRDFPTDGKKYCYSLNTEERRRYLVRATFLYGNSTSEGRLPKFQLYLDATKWSSVTMEDASRLHIEEMIIRATSHSINVCLCCATIGSPFISTLELRPLNQSMYDTEYEDDFYLKVAARVNFGAQSKDALRYPDDPYDRIWESDLDRRQNFLVGMAPGTERINTTNHINTNTREHPPVKVMQTAVVGTKGKLSYRLNLEDFPANARAYAYFAEIEDLRVNEKRRFKMVKAYSPDYSNAVVNIAENANGSYTLYEPSYVNVTMDSVLSFSFVKTRDSTQGPLLNAIEISRYVQIAAKTYEQDVRTLNVFCSMSIGSDWTHEEGDPCRPMPWEWVTCSTTVPPRITKVALSSKKMKGAIPLELNGMEGLTELWLDGNSLAGPIPDMSNLVNLRILHLENNKLTGPIPSYFASLPSLQELNVQNNSLSGELPQSLLSGNVIFIYEGNLHLKQRAKSMGHYKLILGISITLLAALFLIFIGSVLLCHFCTSKNYNIVSGDSSRMSAKPSSRASSMDEGVGCYIPLSEIEEATKRFSKEIGRRSFGPVYYGKMRDGKEIAVKIMADSSSHGTKQFMTEVALLSRIHHRNLVPLIGYCKEEHECVLVYEYMHNGTLRDQIHDPLNQKNLDWLARLHIAEDAAKGLNYLHTGCNPRIIHRDVKTSNILLDINMRAKVSDFGLSRQAEEDLTYISSAPRGTVGYLDPEALANQRLTKKSDVYSFGVVLLELMSGRKPVSTGEYGADWSIVHWARLMICKGDVVSIIDPRLAGSVKIESIWRIAEVAIQCVEQHSYSRPRMQDIILAIRDAIKIEKGSDRIPSAGSLRAQPSQKTLLTRFLDIESPEVSNGSLAPAAR